MRLKEYPEIILDSIPQLYERHSKVFITHLYGLEKKLDRLPKRFCKMYTTQSLANQFLNYLSNRHANISSKDFQIIQASQPFTLILSDDKRLELMICEGNKLGNNLMLLIRRLKTDKLLYYYSAIQQDDLCYLMGNFRYQEWISQGTELLFLNLQAVNEPFVPIDFEEVARAITKYVDASGNPVLLELPLGYEYIIKKLDETYALSGHIKLLENFMNSYSCLNTATLKHHRNVIMVNVIGLCAENNNADSYEQENCYSLAELKWSPVPNRINLIQLCSVLRPLHISAIVDYHCQGNVPPVPEYLKRFILKYSPKKRLIDGFPQQSRSQTEQVLPGNLSPVRIQPLVFSKPRRLAFVDYEDD